MRDVETEVKRSIEKLRRKLAEWRIPEYMHGPILDYIGAGKPTGAFLRAVFSNDFVGAVTRADPDNARRLREYAWLVHSVPSGAHGSITKVREWCDGGGLLGRLRAATEAIEREVKDGLR